jgi:hypothetical protein
MVGEACAYVQDESLKAQAALHVRLTNSPVTRIEGGTNVDTFNWDGIIWGLWGIFGIAVWAIYAVKQKPWRTSAGAFVLWMLLLPIWLVAGKLIF